jgi:4-hydroxy-tetrahydrodipicolinate synthase
MAGIGWQGTFVVAITPFTADGSFDRAAMQRLVDLFAAEGAEGVVVGGSTGEFFSMSEEELGELYRVAVNASRGRMKVLAGTTAITTGAAQRLTQAAKEAGCDGAMLLPPPYVIPTTRELIHFFRAVAEVDLPMMLYNNPMRTGVNLNVQVLRELVGIEQIVAFKESAKEVAQFGATLREFRDRLAIFTGFESHVLPSCSRGGVGVVAMAPNVLGARAMPLWEAAKAGNLPNAAVIQEEIDLLYAEMYSGRANPYVVIKEAMRLVGRPGGFPRPPLLSMTSDERASLAAALRKLNLPILETP